MFLFRKNKNSIAPVDKNINDNDISYETNVLILGCGPAGLGLLVRAARDDKITSLLTRTPTILKNEELSQNIEKNRKKKKYRTKKNEFGLLVIDKAIEQRVGGGKLQDYLIRSNTSSARFVGTVTGTSVSTSQSTPSSPRKQLSSGNVDVKQSNDAAAKKMTTNNIEDDPLSESIGYTLNNKKGTDGHDHTNASLATAKRANCNKRSNGKQEPKVANTNTSNEKVIARRESSLGDAVGDGGSLNTGRCEVLIDVATTDTGTELIGYGKYHVPLHLVGEFLSKATLPALKSVLKRVKTSDLFHSCEAESVSVENDGTYTVVIKKQLVTNNSKKNVLDSTENNEDNDSTRDHTREKIKCHHLIFALGGNQSIPKWLATSIRPQALVIRSDRLLTQEGLDSVIAHLRSSLEYPTVRNRENAPLVCIIGGSHSAFSSAWLLLNGPAHGADTAEGRSDARSSNTPLINLKWQKSIKLAQSMGQTLRSPSEFPAGTWGFRRNDIMILHRSRIKVHFSSGQEARNAGYHYLPEEAQGTWRESIYPFGGLRGDAKRLYLAKKGGKERRLQTKHVQNHNELLSTLRKSKPLVVVWAGGYEANSIPILDNLGNEVQIVKDSRGQYITDNFSQLQCLKNKVSDDANNLTINNRCSTTGNPTNNISNSNLNKRKIETATLNKCFAIGLGAGLPSGREEIGGELLDGTRADGFNVYVGAHGKIILDKICNVKNNDTPLLVTDKSANGISNEATKVNHLNPQEGIVAKKNNTKNVKQKGRKNGAQVNEFEKEVEGLKVTIDKNDWMIEDDDDNSDNKVNKKLEHDDLFDPLVTTVVKTKSRTKNCSIQ
jgi:hypothetical protein